MGGNALSTPTRRLSPTDYARVQQDVAEGLAAFGCTRVLPIDAYRQKSDFGDLDVVVDLEELVDPALPDRWAPLRTFVTERFHARSVSPAPGAGGTFSFEWRERPTDPTGFQVDLIGMPRHAMDVAQAYFSWNDLGNLVGRVAHAMGLVYGHQGLEVRVRTGEQNAHLLGTVTISRDTPAILDFLGFDSRRWQQGFDTLDDIYAFVGQSRYFHADLYPLEHRNHRARTRDAKRATYRGFLAWSDERRGTGATTAFDWTNDTTDWLARAEARWPGVLDNVAALHAANAARIAEKALFNGTLAGRATGLTGRDLQVFMARLRDQVPDLMTHLGALPNDLSREAWVGAWHQAHPASTPDTKPRPKP